MRKIININKKWAFTKKFDAVPDSVPDDWYFVNLPHTWNAIDGQDGGGDYYRGKCCYVKKIEKADLPEADRYYLEINGSNSVGEVYVGGKKLAHHDGGYSTWRVDITDEITDEISGVTVIAITVDNSENKAVYPQTADFTFYGGLYRDVNIIAVDNAHFDLEYFGGSGLTVTPTVVTKKGKPASEMKKAGAGLKKKTKGLAADVEINSFVVGGENCQLRYVIKSADGAVAGEASASPEEPAAVIRIKEPHLWNGVDDPYLYTAEAFVIRDGKAVDNISARFGIRFFDIDPEEGFILNGRPYPLHGVSRHQDRWEIGNALLPEHHREDMDLICELGANTVRLAHYQHDRYFYDLCDERGIIVWAEIPYISGHVPEAKDNTASQLKELIIQNYNHPSIVVWALSNEITIHGADADMVENHVVLNTLAHRLDPTRKTVTAAVSSCDIHEPYLQIPDAVAYNHYFGWYGGGTDEYGPWFDDFHKEYPKLPIAISEYGCEALNWHSPEPVQGDYTEEYQAYYHEEVIKQLFSRKYIWATYVWNMFDFGADNRNEGGEPGQNHKGLVTFDRKYKKDSFYAYKAWLSREPFVHICSKRFPNRTENAVTVTVYSNQPEVEMFVNGKSYDKQRSPEHFFRFLVPNEEEETKLRAAAGGCSDESLIRHVDRPDPAYRFTEKGAVLNWFDIEETEGCLSLNSTVKEVMSTSEGAALMEEMASGADEGTLMFPKEDLLKLTGGYTVLRLANMMNGSGAEFTKDSLLGFNERLRGIKKP